MYGADSSAPAKRSTMLCRCPMKRIVIVCCLTAAVVLAAGAGCSRKETRSYDEIEKAGEIEKFVRSEYAAFFRAVSKLGETYGSGTAEADSVLIAEAARKTDSVIENMRPFPTTRESRLAFDALSYAAYDLTLMTGFDTMDVELFWRNALLDPIFTKGNEYIKSEKTNDSTLLQLVMSIRRGMGDKATGDMLLDIISIVGPNPSEQVLQICESDSLVFRKVFDLLVYSRSLQELGPPVWMMTGPWLVAVDIDGWPLSFYCLKPVIIGDAYYLTFRDYSLGDIYAAAYKDPVPRDAAETDAWLTRASSALDTLRFNEEFAERIRKSSLATYGAHNYFSDYLLAATADTVNMEFNVILKREQVLEDAFQFAGVDSIAITFTQREIMSRADTVTPLMAMRYVGDTMVGGRYIPARRGEGMAFLMPMGVHDEEILRRIRESMLPEITVGTQ